MHQATWRMPSAVASKFRRVRDQGRPCRFAVADVLYRQNEIGNAFYFIEQGFVRVSMYRRDGIEVGLEVMGPDTICGEGAVFDRRPRFSTASAITPVRSVAFSLECISEILQREPDFALDLLRLVAEKQRVLAVKLEHFASRDPADRILELLTRQATMFGTEVEHGCMIRTRLTHEQIASLTGTSRVTVTRALRKLTADGVIAKSNGFYVLRQLTPERTG